jgi:hypothetical protein
MDLSTAEERLMALTCTDCDLEHDLDESPDIGECVVCGGELVESAHPFPVDKTARLREIMSSTIDTLAKAHDKTRETVITMLTDRGYTIPRQAKRLN